MANMKRKATSVKKNKGMSYEEAEAIYDKRANRTGKSFLAAGKNLTVKEMEKLKSRGLSGKDVTEKERAAADKNLTMKEMEKLKKARLKMGKTKSE
jgi:hypothetical protein